MKKAIALLLAVMLTACLFAGCNNTTSSSDPKAPTSDTSNGQTSTPASEPVDEAISERVELRLFAIDNSPNDEKLSEEFWEILNGILLDRLNCTIKYEYVEGNDPTGQYEMALASNQDYDLMHASAGFNYTSVAARGAFMDITDLLPTYAPDLYNLVTPERWEEAKVNGRIYGVPNLGKLYTSHCFMYREDLRKKYNCEPITDLDTMGAYLQAIVDNEPGLIPTDDQAGPLFRRAFQYTNNYALLDNSMNFVIDPTDPRKVLNAYEQPDYLEYLKLAKEWFDNGYWTSNVLSSKEWGVNSVINGKAAASFTQQFPWYAWHPNYIESNNPGWEIKYFQFISLSDDAFIAAKPATENMLAVAQNAKNPERALMVLNLIQTDEELWRLCTYGLEGKNYELTEDGKIDTTKFGDDARFNYFPVDLITNANFELTPVDQWDEYDELYDVILDHAQDTYPLNAFAPNTTGAIEPLYTAINQIRVEYAYPLQAGMIDDVEAGYEDLIKRLNDAGIEEVRLELERQVNEYLDNIGYKG